LGFSKLDLYAHSLVELCEHDRHGYVAAPNESRQQSLGGSGGEHLLLGAGVKLFEEGKPHFLDTVEVFNAPHAIHARYSPGNRATDA
jgi:hypothetical protein